MGERTILVCDVCGAPAQQTVGLRVNGRSLQKDVCADHLGDMVRGARAARRGRRRGSTAATGALTAAPGNGRRKPQGGVRKRRGRPRKSAV
jgi:hypothetical protein